MTSAPVTVNVVTPATVTLSTLSNFYLAPPNVDLIATAVAPGTSTIAKVEFFNDSNLIATVTSPPNSFRWSGVAAGAYSLTAKATDSASLVGVSPPLSLTVGSAVTIAFAPRLNGSTVYDESVLISGTRQAGPNSAVTATYRVRSLIITFLKLDF